MTEQFPFITVQGDPKACGRQHGRQAADLIRFNLVGYWRLFEFYSQLDRPAVLAQARHYFDPIRAYAPHLLEEMGGIADGAGVSLEEILALNCRTELLSVGAIPARECTAVYVGPEATANGHALLAQNWDWSEILRGGMVLMRVEQPDRPVVWTLTEAGMVGKIGCNGAGVGVCANFVRTDYRQQGVPFHAIFREALNAPRLGKAVAAVYREQRGDSGNFLLADAAGEAIDLEATPADIGFLYPNEGLLLHTNHFVTPRLQARDAGILESDNTLVRYGRALRWLQANKGKITAETLQTLFRDHFNFPKAICRHPDPAEPEVEQTATLACIVMDLTAGEMSLAVGEPCQANFYSVSVC